MDAEIAPFGLRSICLEPGYFRTALITPGHRAPYENRIADYAESVGAMDKIFLGM
jgi:NAD(P)-dependent dehydrogenase (short-subunit alcohol dehydrogenase family)